MSAFVRSSRFLVASAVLAAFALAAVLAGCSLLGSQQPASAPAPATPEPAAAPAAGGGTVAVGARVAAPWGDGLYIGTVTAVNGDTADVLYDDDKVTRPIKVTELTVVTRKTWNVGDKVMAVWTTGKFYAGEITAVKGGDLYTVKWDDGDTPTDVSADMIYAP